MEYSYNKITSKWVDTARKVDEQLVIKALKNYNINAYQGTVDEDYSHIDIHSDIGDIDVKRNHSKQAASKNFTLTYINGLGSEYPYRDDAYFDFIDDVSGEIYFINQYKVSDIVKTSYKLSSKFNSSKYAVFPKSIIKSNSELVLKWK